MNTRMVSPTTDPPLSPLNPFITNCSPVATSTNFTASATAAGSAPPPNPGPTPPARAAADQELTLVQFFAQRKRFLSYTGNVQGLSRGV